MKQYMDSQGRAIETGQHVAHVAHTDRTHLTVGQVFKLGVPMPDDIVVDWSDGYTRWHNSRNLIVLEGAELTWHLLKA